MLDAAQHSDSRIYALLQSLENWGDYLADNILVLRYFEAQGRGQASNLNDQAPERCARHTIRELRLGPHRINVGEPLTNFHGVLSGIPSLIGNGHDGRLAGIRERAKELGGHSRSNR